MLTREALPPVGIEFLAEEVSFDEPALALVEMNLLPEDRKDRQRYQLIYVVRSDHLACWPKVMGPSVDYPYPEVRIAGGFTDPTTGRMYIEETVGSLMSAADDWRKSAHEYEDRVAELQATSTLVQDFVDQYEDAQKWLRRESQFGPAYRRQRNG